AGGAVHLVYEDDSGVGSGGNQVFYAKSSDGGATYSGSFLLSTNSKVSFGSELTLDRAGNVYVVWYSEDTSSRGGAQIRVFFSKSTNHGASFSPPLPISPPSELGVIPHIAADPSGKLLISYLDVGARITLRTVLSSDGGASFSSPVTISQT